MADFMITVHISLSFVLYNGYVVILLDQGFKQNSNIIAIIHITFAALHDAQVEKIGDELCFWALRFFEHTYTFNLFPFQLYTFL